MLGLSLTCLYACGSTVFFFVLGDVVRSAHNITKNKKNLLELAKVLHMLFLLRCAGYCQCITHLQALGALRSPGARG